MSEASNPVGKHSREGYNLFSNKNLKRLKSLAGSIGLKTRHIN